MPDADPKPEGKPPPRDAEPDEDGVLDNAIERTDNAFHGRKDDESLIGRDIPLDVQEAEEEEARDEDWRNH
ncbi:MAG: hypothetical protein V7704_17835 [Aurantimonas endophytica]|uniref:Uncharacterized protein n=1 Tax=Aurantimonas endophytica TaxID=1522175 RepID=A0A7W6HEQ0_9HYPH|nr:hypothetical protein [Aurantimonas endophytica]MBB4003712.1 hypothetical protein [Aurantimonas endophytica]MCO6404568.1 hypothetical protein [Aurantimonas endophytica]